MPPPAPDPDDPDRRKRLKMAAGNVSPDEPYTPVARASVQPSLNAINERSGPAGTELFRASLAHLSPTLPQYPQPSVPDAGPAPSPVASTDRQRVDTSQPNPMSATANYIGQPARVTSPDNLYSTIQPGPAQRELERVQAAGPQASHGWGRVGHVALDLLRGNPAGAAVEGVAPGYAAKQRFQRHDLPLAQHNAEVEQGMQSQRVGDITRIAGELGTLPGGPPTEIARHRHAIEAQTAQRQHELDADRDAKLTETKRYHDMQSESQRRRELGAASRAGMMTPEQRKEYASLLHLSGDMREPFIKGDIDLQTDGEGQIVGISKRAIQQGQPAVTNTGVKSLAGVKADRQAAHQRFMESIASGHLAVSRQNAETYQRIARDKGADSPEAEAFRTLQSQNKIDANGMADNPKYLADVERRMAGARWLHTDTSGNVDEAAARKEAEAAAAAKFKPKVAVTELENFKGLKASYKARGRQGKGRIAPPHDTIIDVYQSYVKSHPEKRDAARKQFIAQRGYDPEQ